MADDDLEIISFKSLDKWESWLVKNHAKSEGVWLRLFKKDSSEKTISYAEALDGALCFGWIDSRKEKFDAESWLQRFTPRRPKSIWSKRNIEHTERLIKAKKMRAAGLRQVEKANTYAIVWRLQTAKKAETREKRMKAIIEMLERGEKFH